MRTSHPFPASFLHPCGQPSRSLWADHPRLHPRLFPPCAPELNPVEYLWACTKSHRLANFVPMDISQIDKVVCIEMEVIRHDQSRLRSFFKSSPLPWNGLTGSS